MQASYLGSQCFRGETLTSGVVMKSLRFLLIKMTDGETFDSCVLTEKSRWFHPPTSICALGCSISIQSNRSDRSKCGCWWIPTFVRQVWEKSSVMCPQWYDNNHRERWKTFKRYQSGLETRKNKLNWQMEFHLHNYKVRLDFKYLNKSRFVSTVVHTLGYHVSPSLVTKYIYTWTS